MNRRTFLKVLGIGAGSAVVAKAIGKQLPAPVPIPVKNFTLPAKISGGEEMVVTYYYAGNADDWIHISSESLALK